MVNIINPSELELKDEAVVVINRVSKVITGGRRFRFNAVVAVGDGKGHLGIGFGKANDVMSAVNKAKETAKKNIFRVNIMNGTIPHEINVRYGSSKVMLKPASPGTGVIAGGPVRILMEQVGITDILSKITSSTKGATRTATTPNKIADSVYFSNSAIGGFFASEINPERNPITNANNIPIKT